jgi:hypothetical protein
MIFKDAHPAIVSDEAWKLRETKRAPRENCAESNPLTGILYAGCGHKTYR